MKLYIRAMSDTQKAVESELKAKADLVIEHIIKVIAMPEHQSVKHWKKEIVMFIHKVNKLKRTNKWPTAQQIFNWTYGKWADELHSDGWIQGELDALCFEYDLEAELDADNYAESILAVCEGYFHKLADELSAKGSISPQIMYDALDELLRSQI